MSKLSNKAFAIMGMCEQTRKSFGITVDPRGGAYAFCWAFKISDAQAKREGYDRTHAHGAIIYDAEYNGCPYCGTKGFYICGKCGRVICYQDQKMVTCPNCGTSGEVQVAESFDLTGGGM